MLNAKYYKHLLEQFDNPTNFADLNLKIITNNKEYNLYISFDGEKEAYVKVIQSLYEFLAKDIFKKCADYPNFKIGDEVREKKKNKRLFKIETQSGEYYTIKEVRKRQKIDDHNAIIKTLKVDRLISDYIPATKTKHRAITIEKVELYFEHDIKEFGFMPSTFSGRVVFIGTKEIWDNLTNKDAIPSRYYPKPNNRSEVSKPIESSLKTFSLVDFYADIDTFNREKKNNSPIKYLIICDKTDFAAQQLNKKQDEKLIILSQEKDFEVKNYKSIHWSKSEIDLIEQRKFKEPIITVVEDIEVDRFIKQFDLCLEALQNFDEPIDLPIYCYYLRLILNAITVEEWQKLAERLERDQSLEQNSGEYTMEEIGEHNPKIVLQNLIYYLKNNNPKAKVLKKRIYERHLRYESIGILATDLDINRLHFPNLRQAQYLKLKQMEKEKSYPFQTLLLSNYNCKKDYELLRLSCSKEMVLFAQEVKLYKHHKKLETDNLERELKSTDRVLLFGLKYEPLVKNTIKPSLSLKEISDELEEISDNEYDEIKQKGREKLIDERENETIFQISCSNEKNYKLKGSESVLMDKKWTKVRSLNEGYEIQLYEDKIQDDLLIKLALKKEYENALKAQKDSKYWQDILRMLFLVFNQKLELLYTALKEKGLKVQQNTVERYLENQVMFPMYYSDLKAILDIANEWLSNKDDVYTEVRRSKKWYSSTTIRLGREVKKEIERFVNENVMGENLALLGLSTEQLNDKITQQMPILKIIQITQVNQ